MKKFLPVLATTLALGAFTGCYKTQEGRVQGGVPFSKDTIEARNRADSTVYQVEKMLKEAFPGRIERVDSVS